MNKYFNTDMFLKSVKQKAYPQNGSVNESERKISLFGIMEILTAMPAADVVPIVYGEWIKMDKRGNNVRCSKCGNTLDLRGVNAGRGDANYCPNCGADMRENIDEYTIEDYMFGQDLGNPEDGSL